MTTKKRFLKRALYGVGAFFATAFLYTGFVQAAPVTEKEALEIAEFWYPAEVNFYEKKGWKRQGNETKHDLLSSVQVASVRYLVGKDTIVDKLKGYQDVLAYIVEFSPRGYAVVSSDDSITPLLTFSLDSGFAWENPEVDKNPNYTKAFLNGYVNDARAFLYDDTGHVANSDVHPGWSEMRSMAKAQKNLAPEQKSFTSTESVNSVSSKTEISALVATGGTPNPSATAVLLPTAAWNQGGFYNDELRNHVWPADPANPPAGFSNGDGVPTGCHATALAIKLRYHEWPLSPLGTRSWNDSSGDVFGSGTVPAGTTYNWANMPTGDIDWGDLTTVPPTPQAYNADIATLMFHAGTILHSDWEVPGTVGGEDIFDLNSFLRYSNTTTVTPPCASNPSLPEPNCTYYCLPSGGDPYSQYDYFFCPNATTWANAANACASNGSTLVRIESEYENDIIHNKAWELLGLSDPWIGGTDSAAEGQWVWNDLSGFVFWQGGPMGAPPGDEIFANWDQGEPNDSGGNEDCATIYAPTGTWNDDVCTDTKSYICRRPKDASQLLPPIRSSIVRALPVIAYDDSPSFGHVVLIDGYRDSDPQGEIIHVNAGWGAGSSAWYNIYHMITYCAILDGALVYMSPDVWIYVDQSYSGREDGNPQFPYNTLQEGISRIQSWCNPTYPGSCRLWLRTAPYTSSSAISFSVPMKIASFGGDASFNGKLFLSYTGDIRVGSGASLTVNP